MERRDDFTPAHTGALGFAARGTSSFPGAFPPIGLGSFEDDLRSDDHNREFDKGVLANLLPAYRPPFEAVEDAWFIDGGVLDNKPFGHAIEAIVAKPASNEVRRWVVYLEPDPVPPKAEQPDRKIPGLLQVVCRRCRASPAANRSSTSCSGSAGSTSASPTSAGSSRHCSRARHRLSSLR